MLIALLFGLGLGFVSAIPVAGPVAAMVVERALARRYSAALAVAVGTAVAEALYAALAVLGFAALADRPWVAPASKGIAGAVLLAVGLRFALRRPPVAGDAGAADDRGAPAAPRRGGVAGELLLGFTVTVINPTLLAAWAAVTSTLVASEWVTLEPLTSVPFGLGVAAGVTAWFALLVGLIRRFTRRLSVGGVARVVRVIGWALVGLGVWFLALLARYLLA